MTVPTTALAAAILVLRDFDVPILWSIAVALAVWSGLILRLWSTASWRDK